MSLRIPVIWQLPYHYWKWCANATMHSCCSVALKCLETSPGILKMRRNRFGAGALHQTPLSSLRRSPSPLTGGRGSPYPRSLPSLWGVGPRKFVSRLFGPYHFPAMTLGINNICVCVCVCVFVCYQHDNFRTSKHRTMKLGGRCIVQKSRPSSNLGVTAPGVAHSPEMWRSPTTLGKSAQAV